jgi:hypothetical protein
VIYSNFPPRVAVRNRGGADRVGAGGAIVALRVSLEFAWMLVDNTLDQ